MSNEQTLIENKLTKLTEHQFHSVWTTAVGMEGYNKKLFQNLFQEMESQNLILPNSDDWINIEDRKPIAYESGNWDGLRSDLFLGQCKHGVYYIAQMYEGILDGNKFCNFYDKNEYEILDLIKWKPITD